MSSDSNKPRYVSSGTTTLPNGRRYTWAVRNVEAAYTAVPTPPSPSMDAPTLADLEREDQAIAWLRAEAAGEEIPDDYEYERRDEETIANLYAELQEYRKR